MNNISKDFVNVDGSNETMIASSDDNYKLNMDKNYVLANKNTPKESTLVKKFKKTLIGSDIGIKSKGFSSIAILAIVIALAALAVIYFMWRF